MTNEEAIKYAKNIGFCTGCLDYQYNECDACEDREFFEKAIEALEKQIPKKPIKFDESIGNFKLVCPNCKEILFKRVTNKLESYPIIFNNSTHCVCGQTLDWSDEE